MFCPKSCPLDLSYMPPLDWRHVRIPKKTPGEFRHIYIPNDDLKRVQRQVLQYLYSYDELRPYKDVCGFVPNRSALDGCLLHNEGAYMLIGMDVHNFFDNVRTEDAYKRLREVGVPATVIDYIDKVCTYKGKFAQGAPTSPYLSNIAMGKFDKLMRSWAKKRNMTYTRYADDITLSTKAVGMPRNFDGDLADPAYCSGVVYRRIRAVEHALDRVTGLHVSRRKTHVARINSAAASRRITGIVLRNDMLGYNAPRAARRKTRAMLYNLYKLVKSNPRRASEFKHEWRKIKGRINYSDHIRSASRSVEGASPDPFINQEMYDYLDRKIKA